MNDPAQLELPACPECGLLESPTRPLFDRRHDRCYRKADGKSRRSERGCYARTVRKLRERVQALEAWQTEILIHRRVHNPPPGDHLHAAVAIANAGWPPTDH